MNKSLKKCRQPADISASPEERFTYGIIAILAWGRRIENEIQQAAQNSPMATKGCKRGYYLVTAPEKVWPTPYVMVPETKIWLVCF